jgi:hypothetical protein
MIAFCQIDFCLVRDFGLAALNFTLQAAGHFSNGREYLDISPFPKTGNAVAAPAL